MTPTAIFCHTSERFGAILFHHICRTFRDRYRRCPLRGICVKICVTFTFFLGAGNLMAYLVRDARSRSPYWYGVYLLVSSGGQRRWVRKSTKKRKRTEAKEILDAWQNTADRAAAGNLDQARIREIVLETVERVTGKRTGSPTVSEWLE
jgi:hypothetical protein